MEADRRLTPRQREVLAFLLQGEAPKRIARLLGISVHTVHVHIKHIYGIYGAHSQTELLAMFVDRNSRPDATPGRGRS